MTPTQTPTLWLIRHGETEWSLNGRHTGRTDIPLTENGRRQAAALTPMLRRQKFSHVFCSPLRRARETCNLAGFGDKAEIDPDLQEWHYGVYEGRTTADISASEPGWSIWDNPVPKGETAHELQLRATRVVRHALTLKGQTLMFAHAHILRCIMGVWASDDVRLGKHLYLETATASVLGFHNGVRVIRKLNVAPPPVSVPQTHEYAAPA